MADLYLSLLFSCMVRHGYSPDCILVTTISSIPKNKRKSLNDSDNYRGIALSSVIGKLMAIVLIKRNAEVLATCYQQFGFKKSLSTTQCSFALREIINCYNNRGGEVHLLLLDASRAFDRIDFVKLFSLLLDRGICPSTAKYLLNSLKNQKLRVKWKNSYSDSFYVTNGVKQGGVISPLLFNVYVDELFKRLRKSGIGCYIGNIYAGSLGFADDVNLVCPSLNALRRAYKICL